MFLGFALFANVLPDYLSLLKTRKLLSFMAKSGTLIHILLVLLDFAIAYIIASVTTVVAFVFMYAIYAPSGISRLSVEFVQLKEKYLWQLLVYYPFKLRVPRMGVFSVIWFIPAFLTSIWLWLYVGSGLLVRAAYHLDSFRVLMARTLKVSEKPLQCIGLVAALILTLVYWALLIVAEVV
jgi:hypothetical protein